MTDPVNRPVRLVGLAGVMAVGLVLAGCSGDGGEGESSSAAPSASSVSSESASPDDSSSASPSSSASGSYEPATETSPANNVPVPEMPEAAKEPTEDGLEAAVEFWWGSASYLRSTGDADPLDQISGDGCELCQRQIEIWEWVYQEGGWAMTDDAQVSEPIARVEDDQANGSFVAQVTESSIQVYKPDGSIADEASAMEESESNWSGTAVFDAEAKAWKITAMEVLG